MFGFGQIVDEKLILGVLVYVFEYGRRAMSEEFDNIYKNMDEAVEYTKGKGPGCSRVGAPIDAKENRVGKNIGLNELRFP